MKSHIRRRKKTWMSFLWTVILLTVLSPARPVLGQVDIIGTWVKGTTHAKEPGTDRALIFIAHVETSNPVNLSSVIYGGRAMTKFIESSVSSGTPITYAYVIAFRLNESDIAAATDGNFVPVWNIPPNEFEYASVFLQNVNQTATVRVTASNSSTTDITITTNALPTDDGDMVIEAATCGSTGDYAVNNGFMKALEHDMASSSGIDGYKPATGANETPSVTHYDTNRQVLIGFVIQSVTATGYSPAAPAGLVATVGSQGISLDWNDNNDVNLDGYYVYRSATSGGGYSRLNSLPLGDSNYTDDTVATGNTYYYTVKAVDIYSNESTGSTEIPVVLSGTGMGAILREYWKGISGGSVLDLTSNPDYPNYPAGNDRLANLEGPTNWADSYGARIRGYLHPPTSGDYTFYIASDSNSELWLSSDGTPENASMISYVPGCTNPRQWDKYSSQQSLPVSLVGGRKYYIEVLHKGSDVGENLAVAWSGPGLNRQVITGQYLSPWFIGLYGDATEDNNVDMTDLSDFVSHWIEPDCASSSAWDLNGDCVIDFYEFSMFAENWMEGDYEHISEPRLPKILGEPHVYITPEEIFNNGIIIGCDDISKWSWVYGTLSYDTVHVLSSPGKLYRRSIKCSNGFWTIDGLVYDWGTGNEKDLRNKVMVIRLYINPGSGNSAPDWYDQFQIYLSPGANPNYGSSCRRICFLSSENLVSCTKDGWYEFAFPCNSFLQPWWPFDMAAVRSFHIWALKAPCKTPAFTLDRVMFFTEPGTMGKFAIRVDLPSSYTWNVALPVASYAADRGVKITFGVSPWCDSSTYITADQMRLLTLMGHELAIYAGHVWPNNWQDKTLEQKIYVLETSKQWFAQQDFCRHACEILFQSGGGGWTSYDEHVLKPEYLAVNSGTSVTTQSVYNPTRMDWSLFIDNIGPDIPDNLPAVIANAEADKTIVVVGSHVARTNEQMCLMNTIDALVDSNLVGTTFADIYRGIQ